MEEWSRIARSSNGASRTPCAGSARRPNSARSQPDGAPLDARVVYREDINPIRSSRRAEEDEPETLSTPKLEQLRQCGDSPIDRDGDLSARKRASLDTNPRCETEGTAMPSGRTAIRACRAERRSPSGRRLDAPPKKHWPADAVEGVAPSPNRSSSVERFSLQPSNGRGTSRAGTSRRSARRERTAASGRYDEASDRRRAMGRVPQLRRRWSEDVDRRALRGFTARLSATGTSRKAERSQYPRRCACRPGGDVHQE